MKKVLTALGIIGIVVLVAVLARQAPPGRRGTDTLENLSVTEIKLFPPRHKKWEDVYVLPAKPKPSELPGLLVSAYAHGKALPRKEIKKAVRWVSSKPDVLSVSAGAVTYDGQMWLEAALDEKIAADGEAVGVYEIYAENFDGSVRSDSIKIVIGFPKNLFDITDIAKLELSDRKVNYEVLLGEEFAERVFVKAYVLLDEKKVPYGGGDLEGAVRWVSTDETVAVASNGDSWDDYVYLQLAFIGEGETEVYAETLDGKIKSDPITVYYGNQRAAQRKIRSTVTSDVSRLVVSRLKYSHKLADGNSVRVYPWTTPTTLDISGQTATATGRILAPNASGMEVYCGYTIKLKYNDDFTKYTIVAEYYDVPEVIR